MKGDAFYDRGIEVRINTFRRNCFVDDGDPLARNRQNVNLVSRNGVFVYLGHEIIHREGNFIFAEVSSAVRYGAPYVRSPRKIWVNLYCRRPQRPNLVQACPPRDGRRRGGWVRGGVGWMDGGRGGRIDVCLGCTQIMFYPCGRP